MSLKDIKVSKQQAKFNKDIFEKSVKGGYGNQNELHEPGILASERLYKHETKATKERAKQIKLQLENIEQQSSQLQYQSLFTNTEDISPYKKSARVVPTKASMNNQLYENNQRLGRQYSKTIAKKEDQDACVPGPSAESDAMRHMN